MKSKDNTLDNYTIKGALDADKENIHPDDLTDAPPPEELEKVAKAKVDRHIKKAEGFPFVSPGSFDIVPEQWEYEDLEAHDDDILSYFLHGPDPFDSTFFYKPAVTNYLKLRFPADKPIRDIIDETTRTININIWRYMNYRKIIIAAVLFLILLASLWTGFLGEENLKTGIAIVFVISVVVSWLFLNILAMNFNEMIREVCNNFHSAFQQFSNFVYNNFKDNIFKVDQEEHATRPDQWPSRAKRYIIGGIWQSKRVEYAEKYLMVRLHTAKFGFRGMFGADVIGNLANLFMLAGFWWLVVFLLKHFDISLDIQPFSLGLPLELFVFAAILSLNMIIWAIVSFTQKGVKLDGWSKKINDFLNITYLISLVLIIVLDVVLILFPGLFDQFLPIPDSLLLAANIYGIVLLAFYFSPEKNIIEKNIDATKWRTSESFHLHQEIGDQVYRDKRRIVEEKNRQKDVRVPLEFE